ncbi:MAG: MogA/MoaB family molybdenum cofactor biosynthesis protein [Thermostichus sp. DG02_5_bins_236]
MLGYVWILPLSWNATGLNWSSSLAKLGSSAGAFPRDWIPAALLEALYQGRYKATSVEQILRFWQRRGCPRITFSPEMSQSLWQEQQELIYSLALAARTAIPRPYSPLPTRIPLPIATGSLFSPESAISLNVLLEQMSSWNLESLPCGIITVSDTRTAADDYSGQWICTALQRSGHQVAKYQILKDEPQAIRQLVQDWAGSLPVILLNGGTGIAPRDTTHDAIESLLEKVLPGFGEIFRYLSYAQIGSRAIASRAIAGIHGQTLIFSMPGSTAAVQLAMESLILPELPHLVRQMYQGQH